MATTAKKPANGNKTPATEKSRAPAAASTHVVKPEQPDEDKYKKDLAEAEKKLKASQDALNAIKAKLDVAKPSKDSPAHKKQQGLRDELSAIRTKQAAGKNSRSSVMEKLKALDEKIKTRLAEQKTSRSRMGPYKNAEDCDREIARLQARVDTGTMKLVDEKKALNEISALHRTKKGFVGLDQQQKQIDELKAQAADIRKQLDDPEARALSDRYNEITKELDAGRSEQDSAYKNLNSLRDDRTAAQKVQQEAWAAVKALKDEFYGAKRAASEYAREAAKHRREKYKQEQDAHRSGLRRAAARERLEAASAPAYGDEINTAEGLIRYFDPVAAAAAFGPKKEAGGKFAATPQRKIEEGEIKGMKLAKKDQEEDFFVGTGGKKGKKGKKGAGGGAAAKATENGGAAGEAATTTKFNLSLGVLEQLGSLNVNPPATQAQVPDVVKQLQEKLAHWRKDQDRQTKENIAKAQKEIDRLEAEAKAEEEESATNNATKTLSPSTSTSNAAAGANANTDADGAKDLGNKPAAKNQGVNEGPVDADAERKQEVAGAEDAAEELERAKLED